MSNFTSLIFNIELTLAIGIVTSFILGALLMLIKVPNTDYSRKISRAKNTIAICFFICALLMISCLRHSGIPDYERFVAIMMFVITAISSAILSYSLINVLEDGYVDIDKFFLNVGFVAVVSFVLVKSFRWEPGWLKTTVMISSVVLFVIQCTSHILVFDKLYRKCVKQVQQYYDEEEDQRLKWVHFCYTIMMLTQVFILVYLCLPRGFMKIWILWYSLFMLYFAANFISFIGSHKLMLDAFAYKALSGQDLMRRIDENRKRRARKRGKKNEADEMPLPEYTEAEFARLEKTLDKWVKDKRFREYDRTRDEIARELHTTKDLLHLYFATRMGVDFRTWRTGLRIEEAKALLLENKDASINIIAEASGFSDKSNFHRQFVKIVGCSPKEWRESDGKPS